MKIKVILFIFKSYCPLKIWALQTCIKDKEFGNQDILKTIAARSFNLCQLIEDNELITW